MPSPLLPSFLALLQTGSIDMTSNDTTRALSLSSPDLQQYGDCTRCDGAGGVNAGWAQAWQDCPDCGGTGRLTAPEQDDHEGEDPDYMPRCPACGEPADYCQGHGEMGDTAGWERLEAHDAGDHEDCHADGCEYAGTTTLRVILEAARAGGDWDVMGYNVGGLLSWQGDPLHVPTGAVDATSYMHHNDYVTHDAAYRDHRTDSGWLDTLGTAHAVRVIHTTFGDYVGDDVTRSNCRVLAAHPFTVLLDLCSYSTECIALPLDDRHDAAELRYMVDSIRGLADEYPLWDESDHSELTLEMEDEDWTTWARDDAERDYRDALTDAGVDEDEADRMADEADLTAWVSQWREDGTVTWEAESAVSGNFRGLTDALTARAAEVTGQ